MRNKNNYLSNAFRKLKYIPYGSKYNTGYGGEIYARNPHTGEREEVITQCINKKRVRRLAKQMINKEINNN